MCPDSKGRGNIKKIWSKKVKLNCCSKLGSKKYKRKVNFNAPWVVEVFKCLARWSSIPTI